MSIICSVCLAENDENTATCITCGSPLNPMQLAGYHLPTGSILQQGKYRVEKVLGEGSFGITYLAVDLVNSRNVAIKENLPEKATRQGTTIIWPPTITPKQRQWQLTKFATEARYLSKCLHPSIVKVYEYFQENNTAYMVMDFIVGKPLSMILSEEGLLPNERVKRYFLQIAAALKVIHAANLLHRDIKPENIICDRHDRAILIDFGTSREFIAGQTRQMTAILTAGYAPLEQYSSYGKRWPATDIYALCASMYELLTGELPAASTERFPCETLVPPSQLVPQIDPLLEEIVLTGLKISVAERFQTADELITALTGVSQIAKLVYLQSVDCITEFLLDKSRLIIGRNEPETASVDIDLAGFPQANTISRKHAEIYQEAGQWKVKDLDSQNGTFIKPAGQSRFSPRITSPAVLNYGDEIAFGKVRFRFQNI